MIKITTKVVIDGLAIEFEGSGEHLVVRSPFIGGDEKIENLLKALETVCTSHFVAVIDDGFDEFGVFVELIERGEGDSVFLCPSLALVLVGEDKRHVAQLFRVGVDADLRFQGFDVGVGGREETKIDG